MKKKNQRTEDDGIRSVISPVSVVLQAECTARKNQIWQGLRRSVFLTHTPNGDNVSAE